MILSTLLRFKRRILAGLFSLVLILFPLSSHALNVQDVPNPRQVNGGWVTDMADILSSSTESQINRLIGELEAKNGTEMAVVTVLETAPAASPKAFTTALFNTWGIGKRGKDNGVLFLISKGDRRVEIETGYGVEAILPNAKVGSIIQSRIIPRFKQGDFDGGILAGTKALIQVLTQLPSSTVVPPVAPPQPNAAPPIATPVPPVAPSQPNAAPSIATPVPPIVPPQPNVVPPIAIPESNTTPAIKTPESIPLWQSWGIFSAIASLIGFISYKIAYRPLFLEPKGNTRHGKKPTIRPIYCTTCRTRMEKVDETTLQSHLRQPEHIAQQIGSIHLEGWKCPHCTAQLGLQSIHLCTYVLGKEDFENCSTCQELTIFRTSQVLKDPTWNKTGKRKIIKDCHCCDFHQEFEEVIERLAIPSEAVLISPNARSRVPHREPDTPVHCSTCRYPMKQLDYSFFSNILTPPEKTAIQIGSVDFIGWQCPYCSQQNPAIGIHIRAYENSLELATECPNCQELTVKKRSTTVRRATENREGKRKIVYRCYCCTYRTEDTESIPRKPKKSYSSSVSSSRSRSRSKSGGSFGGGKSGGGGSGGSW